MHFLIDISDSCNDENPELCTAIPQNELVASCVDAFIAGLCNKTCNFCTNGNLQL